MIEILIIVLLIVVNGVFSMSEMAVVNSRRSSLSADAKKGNRKAKYALRLADEPDRFLSTVQIGITLVGILTGIYSGAKLSDDFADILVDSGISASVADDISQIIIVVVVTYLTIIFGELLPKRIGMTAAEKVSKLIARPMYLLSVVASPFVKLLASSTSGLFKVLDLDDKATKVTEDEIRSMVREGNADGEIEDVEQNIVDRVFLLGNMAVDSLMTHRSELATLDVNMDKDEIKRVLASDLYHVYPVIDGGIDNLKGMVKLKDLVMMLDKPEIRLTELCRPVLAIHENMSVYNALQRMKEQSVSNAFIFDEFGCCQGMITLKDILDGLVGKVGEIGDEPEIICREDKKSWLVDGQCSIYEFLNYFNEECPTNDYDFNTIAGLIIELSGKIPVAGFVVEWQGFRLEVVDMDGARIDKVLVSKTTK